MSGNISDAFERASFDGIEFPYSEVVVKGALRHAVHEFPHTAGAEIEKMGRKPYTISFTCFFHDVPGSPLARAYPDLYPRLAQLRQKFDEELTAALNVPNIGTIYAVATSWSQTFRGNIASGESVTLEFVEDQDARQLVDPVIELGGAQAVFDAGNELALAAAAKAAVLSANAQSIFQDINDAITAVQAVVGINDAMNRVWEGKIRAIENLCIFADNTLEDLQDPRNNLIVNAVKDLAIAARSLADNIVESRQTLRTYVTPKKMTLAQISTQLFGTSERTGELTQLNTFEDSIAIPAGTAVKYVA